MYPGEKGQGGKEREMIEMHNIYPCKYEHVSCVFKLSITETFSHGYSFFYLRNIARDSKGEIIVISSIVSSRKGKKEKNILGAKKKDKDKKKEKESR